MLPSDKLQGFADMQGATWQQAVQWIEEFPVRSGQQLDVVCKHDTYGLSFTAAVADSQQPAVADDLHAPASKCEGTLHETIPEECPSESHVTAVPTRLPQQAGPVPLQLAQHGTACSNSSACGTTCATTDSDDCKSRHLNTHYQATAASSTDGSQGQGRVPLQVGHQHTEVIRVFMLLYLHMVFIYAVLRSAQLPLQEL